MMRPDTVFILALMAAAAPAQRGGPEPIAWWIDQAVAAISVTTPSTAPPPVLEAARVALKEGAPAERCGAVLMLGFARQRDDRDRLLEAIEDSNTQVVEHALLALGVMGGDANDLFLSRLLDVRVATPRHRAIAALGLGLVTGSNRDALKIHVMKLLSLSRTRHAGEIATCLASLPPEEGRAILSELLQFNRTVGGQSTSGSEGSLTNIALGLLASRFATAEEWQLVRSGLASSNSIRRYTTAWGLFRNDAEGMDPKLTDRVKRTLGKHLDDSNGGVASMMLLALSKHDKRTALRRARSVLKQARRRHRLLGAAFVIIGQLGDHTDERLFRWFADSKLAGPDSAAWCLAVANLSRRLHPATWPAAEVGDEPPPFPVPEIRARLGDHIMPSTIWQGATAVALARLGDRGALPRLVEHYLHAGSDAARRVFATALLRVDPRALDRPPPPANDAERHALHEAQLQAWAWSSQPQLWSPLAHELSNKETTRARRAYLLRLASIAMAGPNGTIDARIRERIGQAPVIPPLDQVMSWQRVKEAAKPVHRKR